MRSILLAATIAFSATSCGVPARESSNTDQTSVAQASGQIPAVQRVLVPEIPPAPLPGAQLPTQSVWAQQKQIRSGELGIEVDDVDAALARADTLARRHGALLADLRTSRSKRGNRNAQLVIRVPAERFAETTEGLKTLGQVKHEAMSTEDITKVYADLETRLVVKEQTAARLQRLLADRTGRLSDVLEVERELGRVITEIEQMKGERRYYDQRVAISTISVALFEPNALVAAGSAAPIARAFRQSLQVLSTSVAWLVYLVTFLAPWVAVASLGWWATRLVRRLLATARSGDTRAG